jgi:adenylate cyclase
MKASNIFYNTIKTILVFIIFLNISGKAQNIQYFTIDSITDEMIAFDKFWKYHPGDDTAWAAFDFPDQSWDTVSTRFNLADKDEEFFPEIAWFRLQIKIDSSLMDKTYPLTIDQKGASEIYHNGKLIHKLGEVGTDSIKEKTRSQKNLPFLIRFSKEPHQVIAVRYSNQKAFDRYRKYYANEVGFLLNISTLKMVNTTQIGMMFAGNFMVALLFIFFVLATLHLLLYLFFRENKANLYYSIFSFGFSILMFSIFIEVNTLFNPGFITATKFYVSLFFPWFMVPLIGMLYSLFYKRIPIIFWIICLSAIVTTIGYYINVSWKSYLLTINIAIAIIEVIRIIIWAIIKKKDGIWIIGSGVLFFITFLTIIVLIVIFLGNTMLKSSSLVLIFLAFFLLSIVSIPISMSVYLAIDFAKTNKNLKIQLEQVRILSKKTLEQEREKQRILAGQKEKLEVQVKERTIELEHEKEKTEQLLLNTLPLRVVNELKENGYSKPESFDNVSVYFSDIVGFTTASTKLEPTVLINELNDIFTVFDDIMEKYNCERIKTIGDAYLAVCGMPYKNENHAENLAKAALEIREYLKKRNGHSSISWKVRIGLHSGKVVGGIVGVRKYIYDVFGDTINTTSRMESNSEPMRINVSETTYLLIKDKFSFTARKPMEIKGKGMMKMFFLEA